MRLGLRSGGQLHGRALMHGTRLSLHGAAAAGRYDGESVFHCSRKRRLSRTLAKCRIPTLSLMTAGAVLAAPIVALSVRKAASASKDTFPRRMTILYGHSHSYAAQRWRTARPRILRAQSILVASQVMLRVAHNAAVRLAIARALASASALVTGWAVAAKRAWICHATIWLCAHCVARLSGSVRSHTLI